MKALFGAFIVAGVLSSCASATARVSVEHIQSNVTVNITDLPDCDDPSFTITGTVEGGGTITLLPNTMSDRVTSEFVVADENGKFVLTAQTEPGVDTEYLLVQRILTPLAVIKAYGLKSECELF
ncbi:hypothetical protein HY312_00170 [Candidatus Saccharibacteria bacterium]|nr:hypothetical protein [Candidatus Saccharibacteria bacterium]